MNHAFHLLGTEHELWLARTGPGHYRLHVGDTSAAVSLAPVSEEVHELGVRDERVPVVIAQRGDDVHVHLAGETYLLRYTHNLERFADRSEAEGEAVLRAPMPGAVISVAVQAGDSVTRGQALLVIESMKMETTITASCDGTVQTLHVATGQTFDRDALLVTLERGALAA